MCGRVIYTLARRIIMLRLELVSLPLLVDASFPKFCANSSLLVIGCATAFFIVIVGYTIHVRRLNKLLAGTPEEQRRAMKSGVTQQQVDLGWRYLGY